MLCQTRVLVLVLSLVALMGGTVASAQSLNIFGNSALNNPIDDGNAVTLGVKFWSSQPGTISGIRFYREAVSPQGYVAMLYSADSTLLGSATMAQEIGATPGV